MTEQTTEQLLTGIETEAKELETTPEQQAEQAQAEQQAVTEKQEAEAAAGMLTGVLETVLKLIYPYVDIDNATRDGARGALAPVLEKYGVSMGGRWATELNAVAFFGMAGFGVYQQIAAHKAEEAKKKDGEKSEHLSA